TLRAANDFRDFAPLGPKGTFIILHNLEILRPALITRDGGKSWQIMEGTEKFFKIRAFDNSGNHLYGAGWYGFYQSWDAGKNWTPIKTNLPLRYPRIVDFTDPARHPMYMATGDGLWKEIE